MDKTTIKMMLNASFGKRAGHRTVRRVTTDTLYFDGEHYVGWYSLNNGWYCQGVFTPWFGRALTHFENMARELFSR